MSGLKNSRSDFLQYTTDTAICKGTLDISLTEWSAAGIGLISVGSSAEPVWIHDLQLAKNFVLVPERHSPFLQSHELQDKEPSGALCRSEIRFSACSDGELNII